MKETDMKDVVVQGPLGERTRYKTFPQDSMIVLKKVSGSVLKKLPHLKSVSQMITTKRQFIILIGFFVTDTAVSGTYSRILGLQKSIPLETIKKIEIQDGRKNYRYVH